MSSRLLCKDKKEKGKRASIVERLESANKLRKEERTKERIKGVYVDSK